MGHYGSKHIHLKFLKKIPNFLGISLKGKMKHRGSTSWRVPEVSLMFLEMGEPGEWKQHGCKFKVNFSVQILYTTMISSTRLRFWSSSLIVNNLYKVQKLAKHFFGDTMWHFFYRNITPLNWGPEYKFCIPRLVAQGDLDFGCFNFFQHNFYIAQKRAKHIRRFSQFLKSENLSVLLVKLLPYPILPVSPEKMSHSTMSTLEQKILYISVFSFSNFCHTTF